ncbi:hypothetical protein GTCCBUS3UF5_10790 [Geobacillus thermoleovorans CCB_US3_UF5]|uniref:Uncharacterized protein n=1 Tax=Geobacillus thermoleovorans CCB_US3_UF5 TaxID=1111068 RepID=A0ABM5MFD2_GEOTH|nr:hypothetical protein GTCCBUS3UF5_10790 [Geobacillus thermoleovorans CCB_US3_UF5]
MSIPASPMNIKNQTHRFIICCHDEIINEPASTLTKAKQKRHNGK